MFASDVVLAYNQIMDKSSVEKLTCEGCGAALPFYPDARAIKCEYCGTMYKIRQEPSGIEKPVVFNDKTYYIETIPDEEYRPETRRMLRFFVPIIVVGLFVLVLVIVNYVEGC